MEFGVEPPSYYGILGVSESSSDEEIRRAYRRLAMKWHPDKWAQNPALLGEVKQKFQQIQEAYSILSDRDKRSLYDAGLYDPQDADDEVEGFADFLQEMMSHINDARKEEKVYSIQELQGMFWEMAQGFDIPVSSYSLQTPVPESQSYCGPFSLYDSGAAARNSRESSMLKGANQHLCRSDFETYCNEYRLCR